METRGNVELRAGVREEERRRREEVMTNALQQQVDELRHMLREQAQRQQRLEEQLRQSEAQLGQVRGDVDETRQETGRALQLRLLEDQRMRQQVGEVQARVEEVQRPLRNMQAQVNDSLDQVRQQRDQVAQTNKVAETLRGQIDGLRAELTRALDGTRGLREAVDGVQQAQATSGREAQKLVDQIRLVEQEARRRVTTTEQQIGNLATRIEEVAAYRPQLDEAIRQTREEMRLFQPQIDALGQRDKQADHQLSRIQAQAEERDTLMRGRVEEVREHLAGETEAVSSVLDAAVENLHARITEWEEAQREVTNRLTNLGVQVASLEQTDERQADTQRRGEEWLLRLHLDQAQAAWETLLERRKKASD